MTNQEIYSIFLEVISKYYEVISIEVTDAFFGKSQRKEVTIWIKNENCMNGEILASFNLSAEIDPHTINNYAYACLDVDDL